MFKLQIEVRSTEEAEAILALLSRPGGQVDAGRVTNQHPVADGVASSRGAAALHCSANNTEGDPPADGRAALQEVLSRKGGDMLPCVELLGRFNAARVSEIAPDDHAAFVAACQAA